MELGIVTDSLAHLDREEMLDTVASLGITAVELPTGGWSSAPHLDLDRLLADAGERSRLRDALAERGLRLCALNANGNQLHPVIGPKIDSLVRKTVELAGMLEVPTVVLMSGLPGGAPGDTTPNWVTTSWPPETRAILDYQWNEVAIPYCHRARTMPLGSTPLLVQKVRSSLATTALPTYCGSVVVSMMVRSTSAKVPISVTPSA